MQLLAGSTVSSPLAISVVWCVYNALPHFLVLWYVLVSKGISLQYLCRFCILLSFFCGSIAVGLIWGLYPRTYSFKVPLLTPSLPLLTPSPPPPLASLFTCMMYACVVKHSSSYSEIQLLEFLSV